MVKTIWKVLKKIFIYLFIFHLVYLLYVWFFPPPFTLTMVGSLLRGEGVTKYYISLEEAGKHAPLAVIAAEDQQFPHHFGFDFKGIQAAIEYNDKESGRIRGGSTISQQVAKNVFLWQGRTWLRKGLEAYCTLWMELLYSKRRILELYLNVAEMGEGIYGIEAAAQHYFKKNAKNLTAAEAAKIAACLPAPRRYKVNPPSRYVVKRSIWIQRQMRNISSEPAIQALLTKH
jgi:monofunctional biosynthetic peptidoglycan transglycosylase